MANSRLPGLLITLLALPLTAAAQDTDGDAVADAADVYPCDATRAAVAYYPAQGESALFAFEDQWPLQTDLDFNDVVVRGHYRIELDGAGRVVSLFARFDPVALGGTFSNGLALQLPVDKAGATVRRRIAGGPWTSVNLEVDALTTFVISPNLRELYGDAADQINVLDAQPRLAGETVEVEVQFSTPSAWATGEAPFDLFIFRAGDLSHQIHFPKYAGTGAMNTALFGTGEDGSTPGRAFVHTTGIPAALNLMGTTSYPKEGVAVSAHFPNITTFASSGGTQSQDFYASNVVTGEGIDAGSVSLPAEAAPDRSCVPLGQSSGQAALSCQAILDNGVTNDGVYWIDPDGNGSVSPFQAYCDMSTAGGGWMVVWKNQGGAVGGQLSNAQLLEGSPGAYASVASPHSVSRGSGVNPSAWSWSRGRTGLEWLKHSSLYNSSGSKVHDQTFVVGFGATTWNWIFSRASNQACHVAPGPISVIANGVDLGSTDRVNSYQSNRATFGLANSGNGGADTCSQPTSNLISDPGRVIYRLDGGDGLNAIRHLFSYRHIAAGRDASRCNYACWTSNSNGGFSEAFTWLVRW